MLREEIKRNQEEEEEQFITSGNWRGKRNSLSRGAGADPPQASRWRPSNFPTLPSLYPYPPGPRRRCATVSWAYLFRLIKLLSSSSSQEEGLRDGDVGPHLTELQN